MNKSNKNKKNIPVFPFMSISRRRDFLSRAIRYSSVFGLPIVFSKNMPLGLVPIAVSEERTLAGKLKSNFRDLQSQLLKSKKKAKSTENSLGVLENEDLGYLVFTPLPPAEVLGRTLAHQ